ncbi:MAG: hypothetical protein ACFFA4_14135 [Promethearchaeota archaeon]
MKEYKVEIIDNIYSNAKHAKEFENILNKQAIEGWELKLAASFYLVFEREKS